VTIAKDVGYVIAAYVGSAMLYGAYVATLWSKEHRLGRGSRDLEPR
jgi:hypothetical protein